MNQMGRKMSLIKEMCWFAAIPLKIDETQETCIKPEVLQSSSMYANEKAHLGLGYFAVRNNPSH